MYTTSVDSILCTAPSGQHLIYTASSGQHPMYTAVPALTSLQHQRLYYTDTLKWMAHIVHEYTVKIATLKNSSQLIVKNRI